MILSDPRSECYLITQIKQFAELADRPHRFYRIKPTRIVLFDALNYPDDPRQEVVFDYN